MPERQDEDGLIPQEMWEGMQDNGESEIVDPEYATGNTTETENRHL